MSWVCSRCDAQNSQGKLRIFAKTSFFGHRLVTNMCEVEGAAPCIDTRKIIVSVKLRNGCWVQMLNNASVERERASFFHIDNPGRIEQAQAR